MRPNLKMGPQLATHKPEDGLEFQRNFTARILLGLVGDEEKSVALYWHVRLAMELSCGHIRITAQLARETEMSGVGFPPLRAGHLLALAQRLTPYGLRPATRNIVTRQKKNPSAAHAASDSDQRVASAWLMTPASAAHRA